MNASKSAVLFSESVSEAIDDFVQLFRTFPGGRRAITIGGSVGKGLHDERSDLDFRIFHEDDLPWPDRAPDLWKPLWAKMEVWKQRGVKVDGVWPRRISDVDAQIARWIDGKLDVDPKEWSVWGYHLLTDIYNQHVLEDEPKIIARWCDLLTPYPSKLKSAILKKHGSSLKYWRHDYHYASKVARQDVVFLASLSARLVHDVMQILFALNDTFFPGDGANLRFAERFAIKPTNFAARITAILYPRGDIVADAVVRQQEQLAELIDEVLVLVSRESVNAAGESTS